VIKFVIDLQQVGGFPWVLLFPPPIKLYNDITETVKSGVKHHKSKPTIFTIDQS
jgi:hypothetical protein